MPKNLNKRNRLTLFEWLGNEIDELFRTRKTFWFGWMAFSLTIQVLMDVIFWDRSEYLHLLTLPLTPTHLSLLGFRIAPTLIFAFLYMRERRKVSDQKKG